MAMNCDMKLHERNNIIKLQSLVHNQFSSPRYRNLFKYSWYASGYVYEKPEKFENPVDFSFGDSCETRCQIEGCKNVTLIRCGWCKNRVSNTFLKITTIAPNLNNNRHYYFVHIYRINTFKLISLTLVEVILISDQFKTFPARIN